MKGLAFALDPDGYWIELVKREPLWPDPGNYYNLSQTMLRVKNGPATRDFYRDHFGLTLIRQMDFPQWKFSLFFMVSATEAELRDAFSKQSEEARLESSNGTGKWENFDPTKQNQMSKVLWN